MTTFWMRADGTLILATSDSKAEPPDAVASTEIAPESGRQTWDFNAQKWNPLPPAPPDRNSLLDTAISGATTLAALKTALLGKITARP